MSFFSDLLDTIKAVFSWMGIGSSAPPCPLKELQAEVVRVTFNSPVLVARGQVPVPQPPHWEEGVDVNETEAGETEGSQRPAVYLIEGAGGSSQATVRVRLTRSRNVAGTGTLIGRLGQLIIEGTCPVTPEGAEHDVDARISVSRPTSEGGRLPTSIHRYRGDMVWGLYVPDMNQTLLLGTTRVEVYFVLGTPRNQIYQDDVGVWVEALRFLCGRVGVEGTSTAARAAEQICRYCHGSHGLKYDNVQGAPHFRVGRQGGVFDLEGYLDPPADQRVNCYDQAAGLQALCGAVGVDLDWAFLEPFGDILETDLVGWGRCNNPFWASPGTTPQPVVPWNDPHRSGFGNHAFCRLNPNILDSCAGPHTGNETAQQYLTASLDTRTPGYGTAAQIQYGAGLVFVF
jgi:hypothetical protein